MFKHAYNFWVYILCITYVHRYQYKFSLYIYIIYIYLLILSVYCNIKFNHYLRMWNCKQVVIPRLRQKFGLTIRERDSINSKWLTFPALGVEMLLLCQMLLLFWILRAYIYTWSEKLICAYLHIHVCIYTFEYSYIYLFLFLWWFNMIWILI